MGCSDGESNSPVLKHRLMSSCLLTPFRRNLPLSTQDRQNNNNNKHHRHASFARSSSRAWVGIGGSKSPVHHHDSDTATMGKEKCMQFISRMGCGGGDGGGGGGGRHRRRHSVVGDFHYDALSYSLNFDDGNFDDDVGGDSPSRDFSSRLPQSPPPVGRRNRDMQMQSSF
ncbi:hypothetical protein LINPERPRIM_LOCUS30873 [Linum perenne]